MSEKPPHLLELAQDRGEPAHACRVFDDPDEPYATKRTGAVLLLHVPSGSTLIFSIGLQGSAIRGCRPFRKWRKVERTKCS